MKGVITTLNNEKLLEIRGNTFGTPMQIIRYGSYDDIDVKFLDNYGFVVNNVTYSNFKKGQIKNPYDPTIYGIGFIGDGKYMAKCNNEMVLSYNTWHSIIRRCYSEQSKDRFPAYYGICTICEEWLNYQVFAEWFVKNEYKVDGRLHIDKDILCYGNTVYCPDKCLLVPQKINMFFMHKPNKYGLPNGVRPVTNGKYLSIYNHKTLGYFNTVDEAIAIHNRKKKEAIIDAANEYKNIIPKKLYDALIDFDERNL